MNKNKLLKILTSTVVGTSLATVSVLPFVLTTNDNNANDNTNNCNSLNVEKQVTDDPLVIYNNDPGVICKDNDGTTLSQASLSGEGVMWFEVLSTDTENNTGTVKIIRNTDNRYNLMEIVPEANTEYMLYNLPNTIEENGITYDVIGIGDNAFSDLFVPYEYTTGENLDQVSHLTTMEIVFPDNLEYIGDEAFANNISFNISSVFIPNNVFSVGRQAFDGINGFDGKIEGDLYYSATSATHPSCNKWLLGYIPYPQPRIVPGEPEVYPPPVRDFVMESDVYGIADSALLDATHLKGTISIPNSVQIIGESAFQNVHYFASPNNTAEEKVTDVVIGNEVKKIGDFAFASFRSIETGITIPSNVKEIGTGCFGNSEFTSINLNEGLSSIAPLAFAGMNRATGKLTIPSTVTYIGDHAFEACSGLTSLDLSKLNSSINIIRDGTFENCSSIRGDLIIPSSVKTISGAAFNHCSALTSVNLNSVSVVGPLSFGYCTGLESLTITDSTNIIQERAFFACKNLAGDLIIPDSVQELGYQAFWGTTWQPELVSGETSKLCYSSTNSDGKKWLLGFTSGLNDTVPAGATGLSGELVLDEDTYGIAVDSMAYLPEMTGDLVIPESVRYINKGSFFNLSGVDKIIFENKNSSPSIGQYAFSNDDYSTHTAVIPREADSEAYFDDSIEIGLDITHASPEVNAPKSVSGISKDQIFQINESNKLVINGISIICEYGIYNIADGKPTFFIVDSEGNPMPEFTFESYVYNEADDTYDITFAYNETSNVLSGAQNKMLTDCHFKMIDNFNNIATQVGEISDSFNIQTNDPIPEEPNNVNVAAIVGGAVGGVIFLGLIIGLTMYFVKKKKNLQKK